MTQQLSPSTQAVLDAFRTSHTGPGCLAAALRAVAEQLGECRAPGAEFEDLYSRIIEVGELLAIAAELEAL